MKSRKSVIMSDVNQFRHIYGTVKVGDRGQIVIPADARKDLGIKPGDVLLVLTGRNRRGLAIVKADDVKELMTKIMSQIENPTE